MADLSTNLAGIKSPNPFWIASGPPGNTAYQAHRAFEAGWGGVVTTTIGLHPVELVLAKQDAPLVLRSRQRAVASPRAAAQLAFQF